MDESRLVSDFFGRDVLLGDRALKTAITERGQEALRLFIPEEQGYGAGAIQVQRRLAKLAESIDASAIDYLTHVIRSASGPSAHSAAPAFAGLHKQKDRAAQGLVAVLKKGEIDSQRLAIEALGYLGADDLAFCISEFAEHGEWIPQSTHRREPDR